MKKYIVINKEDNVLIALEDLVAGEEVLGIKCKDTIKKGHKMALKEMDVNDSIIKYGAIIGHATCKIIAGEHVHTHNVKTNLNESLEYQYEFSTPSLKINSLKREVKMYLRKNNSFGIRNELWVIPTVGCVISQVQLMINEFKKDKNLNDIDGIYTFNHPYGCSQMGDDHDTTKKALQMMVKHPNAGAVLIVGLGCENNQVKDFVDTLGEYDQSRIKYLVIQEVEDEIEAGKALLNELYEKMRFDKRIPTSLSNVKVGLKCGGSDGLSGITANPLLGRFSDYLIECGGVSVLTEVPEMFGAETLLMKRAKNEEVFHKIVKLINDFKYYFQSHDQVIYENPSPGNKEGGITTLEDKSLGCTQKAGSSIVVDVLNYTEPIKQPGLNLLSAPGNDLVASTALGISGCHLVLFTTGRGTPYGTFVPTVKISTNSLLANRKPNWIDFNAGVLIEDQEEIKVFNEFIDYIVQVINGEKTNNEKNNFREIAIFKTGVTL